MLHLTFLVEYTIMIFNLSNIRNLEVKPEVHPSFLIFFASRRMPGQGNFKMASSLSDEEFSRMQVKSKDFDLPADFSKVISIFVLWISQAQLIELRTVNYELDVNCQRQQSGKWSCFLVISPQEFRPRPTRHHIHLIFTYQVLIKLYFNNSSWIKNYFGAS